MKELTFYFDVISPYAYLAFHQLPQVLQGLNYQVRYQPKAQQPAMGSDSYDYTYDQE